MALNLNGGDQNNVRNTNPRKVGPRLRFPHANVLGCVRVLVWITAWADNRFVPLLDTPGVTQSTWWALYAASVSLLCL